MPLSPGTRLGAFEILAAIGAGGMGEVYRARDTKLNRDVALKVLPDSFVDDDDRVARFRREAHVLASLNNPHIGAIYGIEEVADPRNPRRPMRALVLELVDGDTLATRLRRGPIPLAEALAFARQIADALEVAHDRGIVHRDLKPANMLVTPDGVLKVLDFGLARSAAASVSTSDVSQVLTDTGHATLAGVLLGTAAYMSPEQAKGRPVDKRSDMWAFGVVLYEMLTGRAPFGGDDTADFVAHILTQEPDWRRLPANTPAPIVKLLRRCLEKDPKQRLDSAAVARLEIDDALQARPAESIERNAFAGRRSAIWASAAVVVSAVVTSGVTHMFLQRASAPAAAPARLAIVLPPSQLMPSVLVDRDLALSPDGRYVVYRVGGSVLGGGPLAIRAFDQLEGRLLPGIDNARAPFFSPDGQWVGFVAGPELKRISIAGGSAMTICGGIAILAGSPSWGADDTIVFPNNGALFRVPSTGGEPTMLSRPEPPADSPPAPALEYSYASLLPGGDAALVTLTPPSTWFGGSTNAAQIAVMDLKSGTRKMVIRSATAARYIPATPQAGYVVYASAGTLFGIGFDLQHLAVRGDPVPLVEHVAMAPGGGVDYDISQTGTLVYVPAGPGTSRSMVWVDRVGRETPTKLPPRAYTFLRLSPDGTRVVLTDTEDRRLWVWDVARETLRALTFGSSEDGFPVWTADSRSIIFNSNRTAGTTLGLYSQLADGSGAVTQLTATQTAQFPNSVLRDGTILAAEFTPSSSSLDVIWLSAAAHAPSGAGPATAPMPFVKRGTLASTRASEYDAIASPSGRFFAYQSDESGRSEVYVKPFPQNGEVRWQVSSSGGTAPAWAPNGRELFYRDLSGALIRVPVETDGGSWRAGTPMKLLDAGYAAPTDMFNYDVAADGQRFLMLKEAHAQDAPSAQIVVVLNWIEELKAKVQVPKS